jgi:hypothetical protein
MPFNSNPGDAAANSYPTVVEFKDYWAQWPARVPEWVITANDATIQANLMAATMMTDALCPWTGNATTDVQALCWPRQGMMSRNNRPILETLIPRELKNAVCEYAGQLGATDWLGDDDALKNNIMSVRAGEVDVRFQREQRNTYQAADIQLRLQSPEFNFLSRELPDAVRRQLVPSWIEVPQIFRPLIFRAN